MKIRKIESMCKREKSVCVRNVIDADGVTTQWIGITSAIFPLIGMPMMDSRQLFTILNIPSDKAKDYQYDEKTIMEEDSGFQYFKEIPEEGITGIELCQLMIQISMINTWTIFKKPDNTFIFTNESFLKPIEQLELPRFFLRGDFIVCKTGMLNAGVIGRLVINPEDDVIQGLKKIVNNVSGENQEETK